MFCLNCGTQLPDDANFCLKCGKPQKLNVQIEEPQWETCEIVWSDESLFPEVLWEKGRFWAKAIGPKGVYTAAKTKVFNVDFGSMSSNPQGKKALSYHSVLVEQLVKDGWEPTTDRGQSWWSNMFRRRIK